MIEPGVLTMGGHPGITYSKMTNFYSISDRSNKNTTMKDVTNQFDYHEGKLNWN